MVLEVPPKHLLPLKEELHKRILNKEYSAYQLYFLTSQLIDGKWQDCSMFVDKLPDFNVVVAQPLPEEKLKIFYARKWHFIYSRDNSILEEVLSTPGFINWDIGPRFYCLSVSFRDSVVAACHKFGGILDTISTTDEFHYCKDIDSIKVEIPDGFSLDSMDPSMANMASSEWKYADQDVGVEDFVNRLITIFPSSCLRNKKGEIVAYMLMYFFGIIGMLYVKPEHRRQGYGEIVSLDMLKKINQLGFSGVIHVDLENYASYNLYIKIGCEKLHLVTWDCFVKKDASENYHI